MTSEALDTDVVALSGDLDLATTDVTISLIVDQTSQVQVIVDLSAVDFMDSTGLRSLVSAKSALEAESRTMILTNPTPAITRVLQVTGLDELFRLPNSFPEEPERTTGTDENRAIAGLTVTPGS
jgi:anti-sigma B factor antagonist